MTAAAIVAVAAAAIMAVTAVAAAAIMAVTAVAAVGRDRRGRRRP